MEKFKNVVIGFGKAGKTLAKFLAQHDEEVLLMAKSPIYRQSRNLGDEVQ